MFEIKEMSVINENVWKDLKPLELNDEDLVQVNWLKYYKEEYPKKQIVLHHTVSGDSIEGDLKTWKDFNAHIATFVIISRDGTIHQLFSSKYWGYHLGCGKTILDKQSIGIELDSWGQLEERNGKLYNIYGGKVDVPVMHYPNGFRGEQIFEAYTEAQLKSLGELLLLLNKTYNITLTYHEDMWDVTQRALIGTPGVWAHVSFRPWPSNKNKWDCHPDKNLINMIKELGSR